MKSIKEWMQTSNISARLHEGLDPLDADKMVHKDPKIWKKHVELVKLKGKMVDGCKGIEDLAKFKDSFAKAKDLIAAAAENADSNDLKQYIQNAFWYVYVDGVYQVIDKSVKSSLADPENLAKWLKAVEGISKWLVPVLK